MPAHVMPGPALAGLAKALHTVPMMLIASGCALFPMRNLLLTAHSLPRHAVPCQTSPGLGAWCKHTRKTTHRMADLLFSAHA